MLSKFLRDLITICRDPRVYLTSLIYLTFGLMAVTCLQIMGVE